MLTIKKLSSNGFLTEEGWKSCDKFKVLVKPLFLDLKVGDTIDDIKYKNVKGKDYVIDFTICSHADQEKEFPPLHTKLCSQIGSSSPVDSILTVGRDLIEGTNSPKNISPKHNESPQLIIKDKIRFGQCVNLAFNSTNLNGFQSEDDWIDFTFKRAEKIYKRYEVY